MILWSGVIESWDRLKVLSEVTKSGDRCKVFGMIDFCRVGRWLEVS